MPIRLIEGDITILPVDAIVNAANSGLRGGGGVDGAIHRAGGPSIMEECRRIGYCPTGQAVITGAGKLPARQIIHTVGPVWQGGSRDEDRLLASAYRNSLRLALAQGLTRISFPNISTGVYGFPKRRAARIAFDTVRDFCGHHPEVEAIFVCFDRENFNIYHELLGETSS
jgi:O-acetyl-ADP-ribose deacetylase